MQLLGVHGKKRVGKDSVAMLVANRFRDNGARAKAIAFADMLKEMCSKFSGIPLDWFYDDVLKEQTHPDFGMSPRELMKKMHDVLKPAYGDDLFIRPVRDVWRRSDSSSFHLLIVTDVRYENEADWVRSEGGLIVHVTRDTGLYCDHSSEQGIEFKEGDARIDNNGTLSELVTKTDRFISEWLAHPY